MSQTTRRRKRPHPARRARRLAGWLSIAAIAGLTGGMSAAAKTATTGAATSNGSPSTSLSNPSSATSDDDSWWSRSRAATAVAGSVSSRPVTSSHAS
jgi:hypothetical protein